MLAAYNRWCRAAGHRPATIRLRLMWLRRADADIGLAGAGRAELTGWLGEPAWSPETRKSARSALRSFYRWAVEEGLLEVDPAARLPAVRVPPTVPHPAPDEVLTAALAAASGRDALMIGLAAFGGLRRSEIATLLWASVGRDVLRFAGKGGRVRTVPLLPELAAMLAVEQGFRRHGQVGTGWRYTVDPYSPCVFPSHLGGHLSRDAVGHVLSAALGPGWSGHALRHRFATRAYAVDRDLLTVQQLLGHSSPATTARYTAVPAAAAIAAVAGTVCLAGPPGCT